MRSEFIINTGWRQIADCDCGSHLWVFRTTQAKKVDYSDLHMCDDCAHEALQTRYLIEAMVAKQLETEAMNED